MPNQSSVGLYAQNWIETHKHWLLEEYKTHYGSIMKSNFKPVAVDSTIENYVDSVKSRDHIKRTIDDPKYVRQVLDKLLNYESLRNNEFKITADGTFFNKELARLQKDYDDSKAEIKRLNKEIEEKLRAFENPVGEIEKSRARIAFLKSKMESIDEDIPNKRRDLQKQLREYDDKISEAENFEKNRDRVKEEMYESLTLGRTE